MGNQNPLGAVGLTARFLHVVDGRLAWSLEESGPSLALLRCIPSEAKRAPKRGRVPLLWPAHSYRGLNSWQVVLLLPLTSGVRRETLRVARDVHFPI